MRENRSKTMSETKDAKYFGARIGGKCWIGNLERTICGVISEKAYFEVFTKTEQDYKIKSFNGEGISFEAPKKIVCKEIDCWMRKTWNCEKNKPLVEVFTEVPDYLDRIGIRYHSAKLIWEEEE